MSDFDEVLERLVTDPGFAAQLATDRLAALAGYDLDEAELELLSAQVGGGGVAETAVETRESKASLFGLIAPIAGAAGFGTTTQAGFGEVTERTGFGEFEARSGFGAAAPDAPAASGFGSASELGIGSAINAGFGGVTEVGQSGSAGFGGVTEVGQATSAGFDQMTEVGQAGFGTAENADGGSLLGGELGGLIGQDLPQGQGFGAPDAQGFGVGAPPPDETAMPTGPQPTDYHTRVDVNGDGRWDEHAYRERADGGIDIVADIDHDGQADFVGHDYDRDGLVDAADYDKNHNGTFETHMFDDDGDGWMDRTITSPGG